MENIKIEPQEIGIGTAYFFLEYVKTFKKVSTSEVERYLRKLKYNLNLRDLYEDIILKYCPDFYLVRDNEAIERLSSIHKDVESVYLSLEFVRNVDQIKVYVDKCLSECYCNKKKFIKIPCSFVLEIYSTATRRVNIKQKFEVDIRCWGQIMLFPYKVGDIKRNEDYYEIKIVT